MRNQIEHSVIISDKKLNFQPIILQHPNVGYSYFDIQEDYRSVTLHLQWCTVFFGSVLISIVAKTNYN